MVDTNRRRFLQGVGIGSGIGVAGCTSLEMENAASDDGEGTDRNPAEVAVLMEIDDRAIQQRQVELQQSVQDGELSQQEMREELKAFVEQLSTDAADQFGSEAGDAIEIEERVLDRGALVVSGDATALIEALQYESVTALVPVDSLDTPAAG